MPVYIGLLMNNMAIDTATAMNEGSSIMYHSNGGFGSPGMYMMGPMEKQARHYHTIARTDGRGGGSPGGYGIQRRWQPRRDRKKENSAFGYESDDSSLSSNASGSNKSVEKDGGGEGNSRGAQRHGSREWRNKRKDTRQLRRIAPDRFLEAAYPFQVKFTPEELLNGSQWDNLSQEIWNKFLKAQQSEATFKKKMNLWRYLYLNIKSVFPRYGLYVVGSTMSGFGLEASDMDLCLHVRAPLAPHPHRPDARAHALLHLTYLLSFIRSFDPGAELIQAKVPILKFRDTYNGLQVDLNCNNVVGINNTNLLHCFSRMDWRVRPLVCACKLWARAHRINDARRRTLSSYALTLMVIHFLQCGTSPAILPRVSECGLEQKVRGADNSSTLAELFLHMLRYYAEFPYEAMAVSVRAGARVPVAQCRAARAHNNDPHQWKLLCVEEPFDLTNTARSVYDPETFEKIVKTFSESYKRLSSGLRLADAWPQR